MTIKSEYRFYIQVVNLTTNTIGFVGKDSKSGGYPYLDENAVVPELLRKEYANGRLDDIITASQGEMVPMSDGSLHIPYTVRYLTRLNNSNNRDRVELTMFEIVGNKGGVQALPLRVIQFEVVEGETAATSDQTKIVILENDDFR